MKALDLLYISFQNFKNRKSRVFFTVLGVAVAIAVVLSLVSFGYGLQSNLLKQITTEEALLALDVYPSESEIIKITDDTLAEIRKIPSVEKVSPEATFKGCISLGGVTSEASVNAIEPDFLLLDGKKLIKGELFTDKDSKNVVISSAVADLFGMTLDEIVGKDLKIVLHVPSEDVEIVDDHNIGSFKVKGVIEGIAGTAEIFMPTDDFPLDKVTGYQMAKVKVKDQSSIEDVRTELINKGFLVSSLSDIVTQANRIFRAIQVTLGIFGTFALIVAAIGLVNTMTISLLERTNEIGIMRAIGAAPRDIMKIFLGESIIIGFLGGLCGIVLGFFTSELLNWLFNIVSTALGGAEARLFAYPTWFIFFIVILSTLVGFIGGIWPARRAAKMNPLQALRYK